MTAPIMDVRDFGDALVRTGDLDPVYIAMRSARLPEPQLCRTLLAYWCFYHLGAAAWLSEWEDQDYWHFMKVAARNPSTMAPNNRANYWRPEHHAPQFDRWPRASERRHFRGAKCVQAVEWLQERATLGPESLVQHIATLKTERQVMDRVQRWPMFGPWIAFKAADMLERVYGAEVKFDPNIGLLYESPRAGLEQLAHWAGTTAVDKSPRALYTNLLTYFSARRAPPSHDRPCGPQEVETILCKWDSHSRGGYRIGKDIREVSHALAGWGATADKMMMALRPAVQELRTYEERRAA